MKIARGIVLPQAILVNGDVDFPFDVIDDFQNTGGIRHQRKSGLTSGRFDGNLRRWILNYYRRLRSQDRQKVVIFANADCANG